jgi:signal transduction histidine kinase
MSARCKGAGPERWSAIRGATTQASSLRQQALAAERLLIQERGRLASELHDSLGHTPST